METRSIEPNTENVVKCHSDVVKPGRKVLFTPNTNGDGVYWSHCLSTIDENGDFKVKVINLNDFNLELRQGARVGSVTENFDLVKDSESCELKTMSLAATQKADVVKIK